MQEALRRPETHIPTAILRDIDEALAAVREIDKRNAEALPAGSVAHL